MRVANAVADQRGSSPVEFLLVGTLLTVLTLAVLQLAFAVYVRNVVHDAAVEGAYHAALADTTLEEGADRAHEVMARAIGSTFAEEVSVGTSGVGSRATVDVRIRATLPLIGLIGLPAALEVEGHAPVETFGEE